MGFESMSKLEVKNKKVFEKGRWSELSPTEKPLMQQEPEKHDSSQNVKRFRQTPEGLVEEPWGQSQSETIPAEETPRLKGFKINKKPDGSIEYTEIPLSEALKVKPKEKNDLELWEEALEKAKEKKAA